MDENFEQGTRAAGLRWAGIARRRPTQIAALQPSADDAHQSTSPGLQVAMPYSRAADDSAGRTADSGIVAGAGFVAAVTRTARGGPSVWRSGRLLPAGLERLLAARRGGLFASAEPVHRRHRKV